MIDVHSANDRLDPVILAPLLGVEVVGIEPMEGGRNSRVFKISTVDGSNYVAKLYSGVTADGRSRLAAEYSSLGFIRDQGIEQVPGIVCADTDNGIACYEFIAGEKVSSNKVSASDVDQATAFLLRLDRVKSNSAAASIHSASEACFSLAEISQSIDVRFQRLLRLNDNGTVHREMTKFLVEQLKPAQQEFAAWSSNHLSYGDSSEELKPHLHTLSPSDFGFHNCLRKADGNLVFLDFEHFGWDDPAKMIADFLLHPAMDLDRQLKARFMSNLLAGLDTSDNLSNRVEAVYPLFGIKWCLILLNEFHFESMQRRRRAVPDSGPDSEIQTVQLAKARLMLNEIQNTYREFPYHD